MISFDLSPDEITLTAEFLKLSLEQMWTSKKAVSKKSLQYTNKFCKLLL